MTWHYFNHNKNKSVNMLLCIGIFSTFASLFVDYNIKD